MFVLNRLSAPTLEVYQLANIMFDGNALVESRFLIESVGFHERLPRSLDARLGFRQRTTRMVLLRFS